MTPYELYMARQKEAAWSDFTDAFVNAKNYFGGRNPQGLRQAATAAKFGLGDLGRGAANVLGHIPQAYPHLAGAATAASLGSMALGGLRALREDRMAAQAGQEVTRAFKPQATRLTDSGKLALVGAAGVGGGYLLGRAGNQ